MRIDIHSIIEAIETISFSAINDSQEMSEAVAYGFNFQIQKSGQSARVETTYIENVCVAYKATLNLVNYLKINRITPEQFRTSMKEIKKLSNLSESDLLILETTLTNDILKASA